MFAVFSSGFLPQHHICKIRASGEIRFVLEITESNEYFFRGVFSS